VYKVPGFKVAKKARESSNAKLRHILDTIGTL